MWVGLAKKRKDAARAAWKSKDPVGFAEQERRKAEYDATKARGKVATATPAVQLCSSGADGTHNDIEATLAADHGLSPGRAIRTASLRLRQSGMAQSCRAIRQRSCLRAAKVHLRREVFDVCLLKFVAPVALLLALQFQLIRSR